MKISVIGSGCPTCEALYTKVKKLKEEGKIKAEIEYIKNIDELIKRGIMGSPALLINDKPIFIGMPETDEKLIQIIENHSE